MRFEGHAVEGGLRVEEAGELRLSTEREAEYSAYWKSASARRPHLTDGSLFYLSDFNGSRIVGSFSGYRYWYAQRNLPGQQEPPLTCVAVTGVIRQSNRVLLGRRSVTVTQDAGLFEVVPSGGLSRSESGGVSYEEQLLVEFAEELGRSPDVVEAIMPCCVIVDHQDHVMDIVALLEVSCDLADLANETAEYVEFKAFDLSQGHLAAEDASLSPITRTILSMVDGYTS